MDSVAELRERLQEFAAARDWEQYHTPKNLAMALGGEAGELIAELQWLSDAEADAGLAEGPLKERLADEAADVMLYLVRFTDMCGIDLVQAANAKIQRNETRFPSRTDMRAEGEASMASSDPDGKKELDVDGGEDRE
ncbi:nucleotide pyrophosphohydrolase [Saccharopolyspora halophila]